MLERYGLEDAQTMTAGDVVELANAISHAHAWYCVANSAQFTEVKDYAFHRDITWSAAVVELIDAGLRQHPYPLKRDF